MVDTHLGPGQRRLPPRRVGRRRHRSAGSQKRPDAAARASASTRCRRERSRPRKTREAAALVLGLGRDRRDEQGRLLAVHAQHQPAVRPERSARHAARARPGRRCSRATSAGPRACAPRCGPGACRSSAPTRRVYSPVLTGVITPRGRRRRRAAPADPPAASTCRWAPAWARLKGRMFRIGHLGDCNDLTLVAAVAGVEMGLKLHGVALAGSGAQAADGLFRRASAGRRRCRRRPDARHRANQRQQSSHATSFHLARRGRRRRHARSAPALRAQQWPIGPVRIVVGFPPGGGTDALGARAVGQAARRCGASRSIVENKAGVAGVLAAEYVATQPSDGTHAADGAHQQPCAGAEPAAQAALRPRARLRVDRAGRRDAQPADRQSQRAGQDGEGHRRAVQGAARAA